MATTAPRRSGGRQRSATAKAKAATKAKPSRGPAGKAAQATKKAASKTTDAVKEGTPSLPKPNKFARKLAARAAKKVASKMLEAAAERLRILVDKAAETGHVAVEKTAGQRLPIQLSIDIAVPSFVAWEEWMAFECLPEGVHNVTDIERDGDVLFGRTTDRRPKDWEAEVLDERPEESFAWESYEGSDCAGLITFHEISERLTRLELNLDVLPTNVPETFELAVHLADKHAEKELRRFKARLELINPDVYEDELKARSQGRRNGGAPRGQDEPEEEEPEDSQEEDAAA